MYFNSLLKVKKALTLAVSVFAVSTNILCFTPLLNYDSILISGNANPSLAKKLADELGMPLGQANVNRFNDGEIQIQIEETVRNKNVFIIQSICPSKDQSINDNLLELFFLIRTVKRSFASNITVVMPYYGYARQDRKVKPRVPISAADVAQLIEWAGTTRVITIDLHCGQIQGFFTNVPVDNLYASFIFTPYIARKELNNVVIVSPDAGGVERADQFIKELDKKGIKARMAIISKQREKAGVVGSMNLIGTVEGADAIIIDDMCDTGGTLIKAAQLLKDNGAKRIFAVITHPVFSGKALENIGNSVIDEMIISDTIPLRDAAPSNITVISISPLLKNAILCLEQGKSLEALFK